MDRYPPVRRRRQLRHALGVLVALVAIAGIGTLLYGQLFPGDAPDRPSGPKSSATTSPAPRPEATTNTEPEPRGDTILTCQAEGGTVFYTNATRCEDADLDNRVNVMPSLPRERPEAPDCLGAQPGGPRAQQFLAVCQEPFNEALELELLLLESSDPAGSRAARRYCALITEGVQAGCMATSDQFCFLSLCESMRDTGSR